MTKYELPNGTTVMIPTELLLRLSDDELKDYLAGVVGFETNDPFYDSVLNSGEEIIIVVENEEDLPEGFKEEES